MAGMDVRAALTVVGDGPVGAVGQAIDQKLGMPPGHAQSEWALGMKMVVELPERGVHAAGAGTVWHTFGYPEPEIFGFLYVHPERLASVGIFVPSWLGDPARTAYRYLQHFIQHPALWRYLKDGTLRSWGAKSLQESGKHGEPFLAGDGFARIGEGSGSTNMLTGSGVDEAWTTGVQLAEAVVELLRAGKAFTRENLEATYVARRRASWVEREAEQAENARNGFHRGLVRGLIGMALAGLTRGRLSLDGKIPPAQRADSAVLGEECGRVAEGSGAAGARGERRAVSAARCADDRARLAGDRVRRPAAGLASGCAADGRQGAGDAGVCRSCGLPRAGAVRGCAEKTCIAMCSGQAITQGRTARSRSTARNACTAARACGTARTPTGVQQYRVSRRRGRAALGGELKCRL